MPTLRVNHYDFSFAGQGAGAPVLLIHGSLTDYRHWEPQMAPLAAAGLHPIAISLRHYWPEQWDGKDGGFTVDQHVEDMAAIIKAIGAGSPMDVVGHSRGAHIAFRLAERHPADVRRLVLAEPSGVLDESLLPPGMPPASYTDFIHDAVERIRHGDVDGGLRSFAEYTGGKGAWDLRPEERKQVGRDNAYTLIGQISEGRKPYSRSSAEAIRAPTLLVGGARTQKAFVTVLDGLERAIVDARRITIPDAGHAMNKDYPEAFNRVVVDFVSTHAAI